MYFDTSSLQCSECGGNGLAQSPKIILLVATIVLVLCTRWWCNLCSLCCRVMETASLKQRLQKVQTIMPQLKLIIGFMQIVSVLPSVYAVPPIPELQFLHEVFATLNLNWIALINGHSACIGGFRNLILIVGVVPVCMYAVALSACALKLWVVRHSDLWWKRPTRVEQGELSVERSPNGNTVSDSVVAGEPPLQRTRARGILHESCLRTLPSLLMLVYLATPSISSIVFRAFVCVSFQVARSLASHSPCRSRDRAPKPCASAPQAHFDGSRRWFLAAELSVECYTGSAGSEHQRILHVANLLMLLWTIAVPVRNATLVLCVLVGLPS